MWIDTLTLLPDLFAPVISTVAPAVDAIPTADTGVNSPNILMPLDASSTGDDVDWTMWMINYISFFFAAVVILAMIGFAIVFRQRGGVPQEGRGASHSTTLEITWTLIPTLIVLVIFTFGFRGYLSSQVPPTDAIQISANGKMWAWFFTYPDALGRGAPELWVPVNEPVQITLDSSDVIHSLYIPAFRVKKDVVPGRYNTLWFTADKEGTYELFCTEYCGTLHAEMITKVHVVSREEYDKKMEEISDPYADNAPFWLVGQQIHQQNGCAACHSIDGSVGTGPSWKDLWGAERQLDDGSVVIADQAYITESIRYPGRKILAGWGNVMPSYAAQLSDKDSIAVGEYIKTLTEGFTVNEKGAVVADDGSVSDPREDYADE
ncbi:MAG: cytochrome c oxidase subunit II [Planctomycetota bacterium]